MLVKEFEESVGAGVGAEDATGDIAGVCSLAGGCVEPGDFSFQVLVFGAVVMALLTSQHKHPRRRSNKLELFSCLPP